MRDRAIANHKTRPSADSAEEVDLCVLYLSEDGATSQRLVDLLRRDWTVWSAQDIAHGNWEVEVRRKLPGSRAVVVLLSGALVGERGAIIADEMRLAARLKKPLFPFVVGAAEVPIGFGSSNHTESNGWTGDPQDQGFQTLCEKIAKVVPRNGRVGLARQRELRLGKKRLAIPTFILSLSGFETQLPPESGLALLRGLEPTGTLVSAYDAYPWIDAPRTRAARDYKALLKSGTVVMLDSGNYEASHRNDFKSRTNRNGWSLGKYRETAIALRPDLALQFDNVRPTGRLNATIRHVVESCRADQRAVGGACTIAPIVHVPSGTHDIPTVAATAVSSVAAELNPPLVAIPERELGDGLLRRFVAVQRIRAELERLGTYIPLHLLGTGNPLSIAAFAVAGADTFDGLEWCRTVADYPRGELFHFQQFDLVGEPNLSRLSNERARLLARDSDVPYSTRVLSYNFDFFEDWSRTMRELIHAGQEKVLLKNLRELGPRLLDLNQGPMKEQ